MPRFAWTTGALHLSIATGVLLVGAVLMAVSSAVAWGQVAQDGARFDIYLSEARLEAGGFSFGQDWSSETFDDADGIGAVRAGSTLWLVATITSFISMAVVGFAIAFRHVHFVALGSILASIGALMALAGLIAFPMGAEMAWDWFAEEGSNGQQAPSSAPEDISWGAGLGLGIAAVATTIGGIIAAFTATRHDDVT